MKLTGTQESDIKFLLSYIDSCDLQQIARTVTGNAIEIRNIQEALKCILLHEKDVHTLLNRKKVTKEVLLKFLNAKNIEVPGCSEKHYLIDRTLEIFKSNDLLAGQSATNQNSTRADADDANDADEQVLADMGKEFLKWFNGILNAFTLDNSVIDEGHFWSDCRMRIIMRSQSANIVKDASGSQYVVKTLCDLLKEYKLYFNLGFNDWVVSGSLNECGLLTLQSSGTLHNSSVCIGIFQQAFGLIRDPLCFNNWKIKLFKMFLTSGEAKALQSVEDTCSQVLSLQDIMD